MANKRFSVFSAAIFAVLFVVCLNGPVRAETASAVVTTTADAVADEGVRSLREAITYANSNPGTTISFNIPLSHAVNGVFTIRPTSAYPNITAAGTVIDGHSQALATGDTNPAGPEVELDGTNAGGTWGTTQVCGLLFVHAPDCVVQGLVIHSFSGLGLRLFGNNTTGTRVTGCYIGTDATGTTARPNGSNGIALHVGANNALIGGTTAEARNIVAGNNSTNIVMSGSGTDNNVVQGNYIGTNAAGNARLGNSLGIHITGGPKNNTVGGTSPGAGNVIVGAGSNIQIQGLGTSDNSVQGNFIGTDKTGMTSIHNAGHSILITHDSVRTLVGGTTTGARNIISDGETGSLGITFSDDNTIQGNYIGVNAAGTGVLGTSGFGIVLYAGSRNTVGGTSDGAGNVVTGNNRIGVWLLSEPGQDRSTQNSVQGNLIGTDPTGTTALGSQTIGVEINGGCDNNVIGLDLNGAGKGNIIAFNAAANVDARQGGVIIQDGTDLTPAGNTIRGNSIHSNGSLGINIAGRSTPESAVTPNDSGDADEGANAQQNFPIVNTVLAGSPSIVSGTLDSTPDTDFLIDFYANTETDASGHGEGRIYLGATEVHTNANGDAVFTANLNRNVTGQFVTATATNRSTGNTSEFSAHREAVPSSLISGRITTNEGVGISDVLVSVGGVIAPVTTNSNGEYSFPELPAGTYTITPSRSGYLFTATGFSNPVTVGPDRTGVNFIGKPPVPGAYTVRGRIANHSGMGISGISVVISGGRQVSTDGNGEYIFSNVALGNYSIAPLQTPALNGVTFTPGAYDVIVNSSNLNNISYTTTYTVSGRVTNHMGAGIANVQVKRTAGGSTVSVFTDAIGNYRFEGVRSDNYVVEPVLTPAMSGMSFTPSALNVAVERSNRGNINFIGMFSISGRLTNHSGAGIPNVQIQRVAGSSIVSIFTDSSGNYRFAGVRSGSYTLAPVLTPSMSGMSFTPASTNVTVETLSLTNQNFIGMFSISGRITRSGSEAITNVLVRLSDGSTSTTVLTDGQGNYRFPAVRSGSYTLTASLIGTTFTPATRGLTLGTLSVTNQNFISSG